MALISSGLAEAAGPERYDTMPQAQQTLKSLWEQAQKYSGITSIHGAEGYNRFPVYKVTPGQMVQYVCPSEPLKCRDKLAAFLHVSKRIFMLDDMDPDKNAADASVLVHELVHGLQSETHTPDDIEKNCEAVEQQAIDAQNRFLESRHSTFRMYSGHTCS